MNKNKKAAFLIYVENQTEFETFLQATDYLHGEACGLGFLGKNDTLKRNYIIVDLLNRRAMWGGNDLRPFGYYTPEYCSISGGAMKVDSFIKICKLLAESQIPSKEYVVPVTDEVSKVLSRDGYTWLHRPYFGMQGSTHKLYTIDPLSQYGVDAAKIGTESLTEDEFMELYMGAKKDVASFIKEKFTLLQAPVKGFTFITDDGQFVNLAEKGYDYNSFIDELEKQNYNVDVDHRRIPNLEENGYIYCDTEMSNGFPHYPYLNFFKLPTSQQFETLKLWIESLSDKAKLEVIYARSTQKRFWMDRTPIDKIFNYIKRCAESRNTTGSPT